MARSQQTTARILTALVDEQSRQRVRVSRLLHDEVGQILSAVGLQLDSLRLDAERESPEYATRLETCLEHLGQAIDQVRALSQELNPSVVERAGLPVALRRLVESYRDRQPNIFLSIDSSLRLPLQVATALYGIAEQGLDNAVSHGRAGRIDMVVEPSRGGLVLTLRDDGDGFDPETTDPGLGLLLIEHFAGRADLTSSVTSGPGRGTIVKAFCPKARLEHGLENTAR